MLDESYLHVLRNVFVWTKVARRILTFWTFHCFCKVIQIPPVIIETISQILYKPCTILKYLSLNISVKCNWNTKCTGKLQSSI